MVNGPQGFIIALAAGALGQVGQKHLFFAVGTQIVRRRGEHGEIRLAGAVFRRAVLVPGPGGGEKAAAQDDLPAHEALGTLQVAVDRFGGGVGDVGDLGVGQVAHLVQQQDAAEAEGKGADGLFDIRLQRQVLHIGARIITQGAEGEVQRVLVLGRRHGVAAAVLPPSQLGAVDAHQLQQPLPERDVHGIEVGQLPPGGDESVFRDGLGVFLAGQCPGEAVHAGHVQMQKFPIGDLTALHRGGQQFPLVHAFDCHGIIPPFGASSERSRLMPAVMRYTSSRVFMRTICSL